MRRHRPLARLAPLLAVGLLTLSCSALPIDEPIDTPSPSPTPAITASGTSRSATPTPVEPTSTPVPLPERPPLPRLTAGTAVTITEILMVDAQTGWAIGGLEGDSDHVLRTVDGGESWQDLTPPEPAPDPDMAPKIAISAFLDADNAWVIYSAAPGVEADLPMLRVWRTADGGQSWTPSVPLETNDLISYRRPLRMTFADSQHGWMLLDLGAGMMRQYVALYRTADGGQTWEQLVDPMDEEPIQLCPKTGLTFADGSLGWLTRDCHGFMQDFPFERTENGGADWLSSNLPILDAEQVDQGISLCYPHSPRWFTPPDGVIGVTCIRFEGDSPEPILAGYTYRTNDAGETWSILRAPPGDFLWLDPERGWSLSRTISWTEDGGETWRAIKNVAWDGQFSFVDAQNGWAVARNEDEIALVRTEDGARTWSILEPVIAP